MGLVMGVCDRVAVLDFGEKIAEGAPADIQTNQRVIDAYLGVPSDAAGD
jgi:branched-chain amino acid transport system ATP-binding protein